MNHPATILRRCIVLSTLSFLLFVTLVQGTVQPTGQQRAMRAAQQLREYRHQTVSTARDLKQRTVSGLSFAGATLRMDKTFHTSSTVFYWDDMEAGVNGWSTLAYTGQDLWHQDDTLANSPTHSWWAGLRSQSTYNTGARVDNALVSPPINLTGGSGAITLMFSELYVTEEGWDFCMVDITTDGGTTWIPLRGAYGAAPSGNSGGWLLSQLNLTPYVNQTVQIRFYFDTYDEKFNDFPGWFVDNVVLFDQGGMIVGKKFFDANNNAVKDSTDHGIKDWLITATGTGNSAGVTFTTRTAVHGRFTFVLPLGTYTVTEEQQQGWIQTFPQPFPSHYDISLATADTLVDSVWFGNYTNASFVNGMKFNDVNQNGVFDAGDSALAGWRITLTDTLGNLVDYDVTDSLGQYQLFIFSAGRYIVNEVHKKGWVESFPTAGSYVIDVPDLSTVLNGMDFGNYYSPTTNAIIGQKFNDRNRNHAKDTLELGVPGVTIHLLRKGNGNNYADVRHVKTDSSGYYEFLSVPADTYRVREDPYPGWWQSYPDSFYTFVLDTGGTFQNIDFGNYEIQTGSISGMKFNDINGNGQKEPADTGLGSWTIQLTGTSVYNIPVNLSQLTDHNGNYSFAGLWPGNYLLSEVFRTNWRQTYPPFLRPNLVALGPEENRSDVLFGNTRDSSFNLSFRTFTMLDLANAVDAKGKPKLIPAKPYGVSFCANFTNAETTATRLTVKFTVAIRDSISISWPSTYIWADGIKQTKAVITFLAPVDSGVTVTITGIGKKPKPQTTPKWWWTHANLKNGPIHLLGDFSCNYLLLPMPNEINMLALLPPSALKVGAGGPHSVVPVTYKDVVASLKDRHGVHVGAARCIDVFEGTKPKSIKKQYKNLTPTKHNNKLFAEVIAFKTNIVASDFNITPGGFGNLIFDDGNGIDDTHPLNGKSLREIAGILDQFMSAYAETLKTCSQTGAFQWVTPEDIYQKIHLIDSAFSGPLDTLSFSTGLIFTAVKALSDVPFLRLDTSSSRQPFIARYSYPAAVPEVFSLEQNYPNPFNPSTTIEFYLPLPSVVTLKVYNTLGQEVATLINHEEMIDGSHQAELSAAAANLASGVYYYRLVAETVRDEDNPASQTFTQVRKMLLLK